MLRNELVIKNKFKGQFDRVRLFFNDGGGEGRLTNESGAHFIINYKKLLLVISICYIIELKS